jgi:thioredoxin-related protein
MNTVRFLFCTLIALCLSLSASAQETIKWYTWEQAVIKAKKENKKILIDVYTDWCGWCKRMDNTTYRDPELVQYINKNLIPVKFNAEDTQPVTLHGKTYNFVKSGRTGYHELAVELLGGRMSYPSTAFMDEDAKLIQAIPGFQDVPTLVMIVTYFATNSHKSIPWQRYTEQYTTAQLKGKSKRK